MYEANDGWVADWSSDKERKYCIGVERNNLIFISVYYAPQRFLSFKTKEKAEKFLEENRELIKVAIPLL